MLEDSSLGDDMYIKSHFHVSLMGYVTELALHVFYYQASMITKENPIVPI